MVVSRNRPRMVVFTGVRDRGSGGKVIDRPSLEPLTLPGMKMNAFGEGQRWVQGYYYYYYFYYFIKLMVTD